MGRYSNPEIVSRLQRLLAGQNTERASDRTVRSPRKQTQVRLTHEELDVVTVAYESGLTLAELASSFGADRRTLANRLEQRGIPRRSRRLTDHQIDAAATLYNQGWSLARIAEHFGVYPQSIRYRLLRTGVVLRPRPGLARVTPTRHSGTLSRRSVQRLRRQRSLLIRWCACARLARAPCVRWSTETRA